MSRSHLLRSTAMALAVAGVTGFSADEIGNLRLAPIALAQQAQADCAADPAAEGCPPAGVDEGAAAAEEAARKAAEEEARRAAEESAAAEAAAAEEASRLAAEEEARKAEQAAAEEAARQAAEDEARKAAAEEEARKAEQAAAEEAARQAAEDEARKAAEAAAAEEAARLAAEEEARKAEQAAAEEAATQDVEQEQAPAAEASGSQKPKGERKRKKADREQGEAGGESASESSPEAAEQTVSETPRQPVEETVAAPQPSPDAPEAKPVAEEPIEQQIEEAAETQTAVVPEEITADQREALKKAEKKRRERARERREELLGAAAVGAAIGALVPILGGKIVGDEGDRVVVERGGEYFVRRDESALLRDDAERVEIERLPRGRTLETIYRYDGSQILTVRDAGGYILRRSRITRNGREIVLYDARDERREYIDYDRVLPPIQITIPRDEYIVPARGYGRRQLAEIFAAPPVEEVREGYSLREVRENERLRQIVRRVDLDTITFDLGSYYVAQSQVPYLADIAGGMLDVIDDNPNAVFLVEGHTDAVGSDLYNLTLSDRRAETVSRILVEAYGVPPENLVVEGYGEQFLKIDTQDAERENRRVTIRNISPLLQTADN